MKNYINIILLALLTSYNLQAQNSKLVRICDLKSNETLIGVNMVSMTIENKGVVSDFDGNLNISSFLRNEYLKVSYTGYESLIVPYEALDKLDTILLKPAQTSMTLGSTGILPSASVSSLVSANYSNCDSEDDQRVLKIEEFASDLKKVCRSECDDLVVKFEIDSIGNLVDFIVLQFAFDPYSIKSNTMEELSLYVLNNPKCFDSLKEYDEFGKTCKTKHYHIALSEKH